VDDLSIGELLFRVTQRVRSIRNLEYAIQSSTFRELFVHATESEKKRLFSIVNRGDNEDLDAWIVEVRQNHLSLMHVDELRKRAGLRNISDYHLLRKDELIYELSKQNTTITCRNEETCIESGSVAEAIRSYFEPKVQDSGRIFSDETSSDPRSRTQSHSDTLDEATHQ
jgi:hypothetical protein